jgi:hypothetical protein
MNQEKRPITVEDLLRLKRAERPAPEFWAEFDRELRTKQLAALVAKRPWWQRLPSPYVALGRLGQYRLPLGAAAALAVTFLSVREYSGEADPTEVIDAAAAQVNSVPAFVGGPAMAAADVNAAPTYPAYVSYVESQGSVAELESRREDYVLATADVSARSEATTPGELSRMVTLLADSDDTGSSGRYIAANLNSVLPAQVLGGGLLKKVASIASNQGFESRALPARGSAVDPLQQMTPPSEIRRSRYLTAMVSTVSDDSLDRTTARMAHRISGDELYERVQRFGTRQGGVNMKF